MNDHLWRLAALAKAAGLPDEQAFALAGTLLNMTPIREKAVEVNEPPELGKGTIGGMYGTLVRQVGEVHSRQ